MNRFSLQTLRNAEVFKISAADSNYFVLLASPQRDDVGFVQVIEIFEVGGVTPPNSHVAADEAFFVIAGTGEAICNGERTPIGAGDTLLVRAGSEHVVRNTGTDRLYCLTTMVPDEGFAQLILAGVPWQLDRADLALLGR